MRPWRTSPLSKAMPCSGAGGGVLDVKEVQAVDHAVLVARDLDVVHARRERAKAKGHREGRARVYQPGLGLDPRVGLLALDAPGEVLTEEAVVVVEADAVAGQPERGDGVEEARGEAAQPAVAERGLRLAVLHGRERGAVRGEDALDLVHQAEVHEVGSEEPSHQELGGEVVELALAGGGVASRSPGRASPVAARRRPARSWRRRGWCPCPRAPVPDDSQSPSHFTSFFSACAPALGEGAPRR